eukprot:7757474-Ditylum_brightwellii.AAC.1
MSENPQEDNSFSTNVAPMHLQKQPATAISLDKFSPLNGNSTSTVTTSTITMKQSKSANTAQTQEMKKNKDKLKENIEKRLTDIQNRLETQMKDLNSNMVKLGNNLKTNMKAIVNKHRSSSVKTKYTSTSKHDRNKHKCHSADHRYERNIKEFNDSNMAQPDTNTNNTKKPEYNQFTE